MNNQDKISGSCQLLTACFSGMNFLCNLYEGIKTPNRIRIIGIILKLSLRRNNAIQKKRIHFSILQKNNYFCLLYFNRINISFSEINFPEK